MNSHANNRSRPLALAIALTLTAATMLTGCGGGGGGGMVRADAPLPTPPPPTPPPPPPPPPVAGDLVIDLPAGAVRGEPNGLPTAENLIKEGEGWLWLGGTSTFTQSVQINAGMVSLIPGFTGPATLDSDVYINPAGRLDHDGIITGSVFNRGKMVVWNPYNDGIDASYGHPRIGGDYIQESSATLVVMLDSDLRIAGDVTLNGGTLEIGLGSSYSLTPQVLRADGTITGQFGNVVLPSVFLSGIVNYGAHDITMTLTPASASSVMGSAGAGDPVTLASAAHLDAAFAEANALATLAPSSLSATQRQFLASAQTLQYATGSLVQAVSSLDSLSGQAYASAHDRLFKGSAPQSQQLAEHLGEVRHGATPGFWLASQNDRTTFADSGTMRAEVVSDGAQAGVDRMLDDNFVVGIAAGHDQSRMDFERQGDQARLQMPAVMAYAHTWRGPWYATGLLGQTRATLSMQRSIDLGVAGRHQAGSELDFNRFNAYLEGGRDVAVGRGRLTPYVGLAYVAVHTDAFVEQGDTGFELIGQAADGARASADLGLRYRRDWRWGGDGWARLRLDGAYRHALHADDDALHAAFVGAPQVAFDLPGSATGRDARWLNLQLDLGRGAAWSGFVRYDWNVVGDDGNQAWWLGAQWKF